jgi:hypothetical protein
VYIDECSDVRARLSPEVRAQAQSISRPSLSLYWQLGFGSARLRLGLLVNKWLFAKGY